MQLNVNRTIESRPPVTAKVAAVMRMFGLTLERLEQARRIFCCPLEVSPGDVVYITGPSGAGKTVLLREFEKSVARDRRINLDDIVLRDDLPVIDCMGAPLVESMRLLSIAGLNDVFSFISSPAGLSEGQQWRYRLAKALVSGKKYIFADEFCSGLDPITAAVVAYNVRKFARKAGAIFFLASSREDVLADLQPDVLVIIRLGRAPEVIYKTVTEKNNDVRRGAEIGSGRWDEA